MGRVSDAKERLMQAVLELIWTGSYCSTTIDQICEKAEVKKGSFYYFFDSKADLAVAAFDANWEVKRAELDSIFSASIPPLERLQKYCDFNYRNQSALKEKYGRVLGCIHFALGCEVSSLEDQLRQKVEDMLAHKRKYLESAIRDAHASGVINVPDAECKAKIIQAYFEGVLTQARIQNDVSVLRDAPRGIFTILGIKQLPALAAPANYAI